MRLDSLTYSQIKDFAGSTIYRRGEDYYYSGHVHNTHYNAHKSLITAFVHGSYGNYHVTVLLKSKHDLEAECDCPYDGYPCKHVVAVLLYWLENKQELVYESNQEEVLLEELKVALYKLSKEDLIDLLVHGAQQHSPIKTHLQMSLGLNNSSLIQTLKEQFNAINLGDIHDQTNDYDKIRACKQIMDSITHAPPIVQSIINWEIADTCLEFINQYGVGDEDWEILALDALENLEKVHQSTNETLEENKYAIISGVTRHIRWGNNGLIDELESFLDILNRSE